VNAPPVDDIMMLMMNLQVFLPIALLNFHKLNDMINSFLLLNTPESDEGDQLLASPRQGRECQISDLEIKTIFSENTKTDALFKAIYESNITCDLDHFKNC
jgi:hypothetical protein